MTMIDRHIFSQLISATALVLNQPESTLYDLLLDQWWGKVCSEKCDL